MSRPTDIRSIPSEPARCLGCTPPTMARRRNDEEGRSLRVESEVHRGRAWMLAALVCTVVVAGSMFATASAPAQTQASTTTTFTAAFSYVVPDGTTQLTVELVGGGGGGGGGAVAGGGGGGAGGRANGVVSGPPGATRAGTGRPGGPRAAVAAAVEVAVRRSGEPAEPADPVGQTGHAAGTAHVRRNRGRADLAAAPETAPAAGAATGAVPHREVSAAPAAEGSSWSRPMHRNRPTRTVTASPTASTTARAPGTPIRPTPTQ